MNADNIQTNAADLRDERAPLFHQYPGQFNPQPGRITIDPERETIEAGYDPEIGNAISCDEYHRRVIVLSVSSYVTGGAIAGLLESDDFQAAARRLIGGHSVEWDGNNHVGRLTDDANEALAELQNLADGIAGDAAEVWPVGDWLDGSTYRDLSGAKAWVRIGDHYITAGTTYAALAVIAADIKNWADTENVQFTGDVMAHLKSERAWCLPVEERAPT